MNLFETTQTIKGWIRSCDKSDQLDLCKELVKDYVVDRFRGTVELVDLVFAEVNLNDEINERRLLLASGPEGSNKREPNINDIP